MAILTTSKSRTVRLVYTGDPCVELHPHALDSRLAQFRDRQLRAAIASIAPDTDPDIRAAVERTATENVQALTLPRVWVPLSECARCDGATVATIRGLSWTEDQSVRELPAVAQIQRTVELGLVELDGNADNAKAFIADPAAPLLTPLYHAIADLTWGNSQA